MNNNPGDWIHLDVDSRAQLEDIVSRWQENGVNILKELTEHPWGNDELLVEGLDQHKLRLSAATNSHQYVYRVFVYGTLKYGFPNHHRNDGLLIDGEFRTEQKYSLYLVGERASPWLVEDRNYGCSVIGEMYEFDENDLQYMDHLERINQADGYVRKTISLVEGNTKQKHSAFAYLKSLDGLEQMRVSETIVQGPFDHYSSQHAGLYRARNK